MGTCSKMADITFNEFSSTTLLVELELQAHLCGNMHIEHSEDKSFQVYENVLNVQDCQDDHIQETI